MVAALRDSWARSKMACANVAIVAVVAVAVAAAAVAAAAAAIMLLIVVVVGSEAKSSVQTSRVRARVWDAAYLVEYASPDAEWHIHPIDVILITSCGVAPSLCFVLSCFVLLYFTLLWLCIALLCFALLYHHAKWVAVRGDESEKGGNQWICKRARIVLMLIFRQDLELSSRVSKLMINK